MYIDASKIEQTQKLQILGHEPWLADIYAEFPTPEGRGERLLTGSITIDPPRHGFVEVSGELSYSPFVACSRCNEPIEWPISPKFQISYRQSPTQSMERREVDLEADELDHYFLKAGDMLDIDELVNDQVNLAIPTRTIKVSERGSDCGVCLQPLGTDAVYTEGETASQSPFSILSTLKN